MTFYISISGPWKTEWKTLDEFTFIFMVLLVVQLKKEIHINYTFQRTYRGIWFGLITTRAPGASSGATGTGGWSSTRLGGGRLRCSLAVASRSQSLLSRRALHICRSSMPVRSCNWIIFSISSVVKSLCWSWSEVETSSELVDEIEELSSETLWSWLSSDIFYLPFNFHSKPQLLIYQILSKFLMSKIRGLKIRILPRFIQKHLKVLPNVIFLAFRNYATSGKERFWNFESKWDR